MDSGCVWGGRLSAFRLEDERLFQVPGHFGNKRHTTKNLQVIRIDTDRNLLFIKGAVPGPAGGFVQVQTAKTGVKKARTGKQGK